MPSLPVSSSLSHDNVFSQIVLADVKQKQLKTARVDAQDKLQQAALREQRAKKELAQLELQLAWAQKQRQSVDAETALAKALTDCAIQLRQLQCLQEALHGEAERCLAEAQATKLDLDMLQSKLRSQFGAAVATTPRGQMNKSLDPQRGAAASSSSSSSSGASSIAGDSAEFTSSIAAMVSELSQLHLMMQRGNPQSSNVYAATLVVGGNKNSSEDVISASAGGGGQSSSSSSSNKGASALELHPLIPFAGSVPDHEVPSFAAWDNRAQQKAAVLRNLLQAAHRQLVSSLNVICNSCTDLSDDDTLWCSLVNMVDRSFFDVCSLIFCSAARTFAALLSGTCSVRELFAIGAKLSAQCQVVLQPARSEINFAIKNATIDRLLNDVFKFPHLHDVLTRKPKKTGGDINSCSSAGVCDINNFAKFPFVGLLEEQARSDLNDILRAIDRIEKDMDLAHADIVGEFGYAFAPDIVNLSSAQLFTTQLRFEQAFQDRFPLSHGALQVNCSAIYDTVLQLLAAQKNKVREKERDRSVKAYLAESAANESSIAGCRLPPALSLVPDRSDKDDELERLLRSLGLATTPSSSPTRSNNNGNSNNNNNNNTSGSNKPLLGVVLPSPPLPEIWNRVAAPVHTPAIPVEPRRDLPLSAGYSSGQNNNGTTPPPVSARARLAAVSPVATTLQQDAFSATTVKAAAASSSSSFSQLRAGDAEKENPTTTSSSSTPSPAVSSSAAAQRLATDMKASAQFFAGKPAASVGTSSSTAGAINSNGSSVPPLAPVSANNNNNINSNRSSATSSLLSNPPTRAERPNTTPLNINNNNNVDEKKTVTASVAAAPQSLTPQDKTTQQRRKEAEEAEAEVERQKRASAAFFGSSSKPQQQQQQQQQQQHARVYTVGEEEILEGRKSTSSARAGSGARAAVAAAVVASSATASTTTSTGVGLSGIRSAAAVSRGTSETSAAAASNSRHASPEPPAAHSQHQQQQLFHPALHNNNNTNNKTTGITNRSPTPPSFPPPVQNSRGSSPAMVAHQAATASSSSPSLRTKAGGGYVAALATTATTTTPLRSSLVVDPELEELQRREQEGIERLRANDRKFQQLQRQYDTELNISTNSGSSHHHHHHHLTQHPGSLTPQVVTTTTAASARVGGSDSSSFLKSSSHHQQQQQQDEREISQDMQALIAERQQKRPTTHSAPARVEGSREARTADRIARPQFTALAVQQAQFQAEHENRRQQQQQNPSASSSTLPCINRGGSASNNNNSSRSAGGDFDAINYNSKQQPETQSSSARGAQLSNGMSNLSSSNNSNNSNGSHGQVAASAADPELRLAQREERELQRQQAEHAARLEASKQLQEEEEMERQLARKLRALEEKSQQRASSMGRPGSAAGGSGHGAAATAAAGGVGAKHSYSSAASNFLPPVSSVSSQLRPGSANRGAAGGINNNNNNNNVYSLISSPSSRPSSARRTEAAMGAASPPPPPTAAISAAAAASSGSAANGALRRRLSLPLTTPVAASAVANNNNNTALSPPPAAAASTPAHGNSVVMTPVSSVKSIIESHECRSLSLLEIYKLACTRLAIKPNSGVVRMLPNQPGAFVSSINLDNNYIGVKGFAPLLQVLRLNKGLQFLNLRDNNLESAQIVQLCEVLSSEPGECICQINLSNNPITPGGATALCDLIARRPLLTSVVIKDTLIQGRPAEQIAELCLRNNLAKRP